jgi:hypothetical protein
MALVPDDAANAAYLRQELRLLHASFAQAPLLGSLLDPARSLKNDLATSSFDTLRDLLGRALGAERPATLWSQASELQDDSWDLALTAKGLLDAARLLDGRYHLVITNVPYLARGKQHDLLKNYCETHYPEAKNDLANVFLERCLELSHDLGAGVVQIVMPQNWLFLTSYKKQRATLLRRAHMSLLARLGMAAFDVMDWWAFNVMLLTATNAVPSVDSDIHAFDASPPRTTGEKASLLRVGPIHATTHGSQLRNPDVKVILNDVIDAEPLSTVAGVVQGLATGDLPRHLLNWWETAAREDIWSYFQAAVDETCPYGGRTHIVRWEKGAGAMALSSQARIQGQAAWGRKGISVRLMRHLPVSIYGGDFFDQSTAPIVPKDEGDLAALWCFASSPDFLSTVRAFDQALSVTEGSFRGLPVDLAHWRQVAAERYPNGLPKPYSGDPIQWLFHGHPQPATDPLQVAVARMAGYRWPAETDADMELADEARTWIARCEKLSEYTDDDGIVCLPSVRGEAPAHDRLLKLLIAAWETVQPGSWKPGVLDKLLADAECAGKGLDVWLREKFFEQHAKRFQHRPFIWHVWDGLKDGFAALVNYHRLDHKKLERLIHTYLGDWIRQQEAGVRDRIDGAPARLAAAQDLKRRLELILEGESPYDIFVRWKPLAEQPIGWNPDLNDGVRLNIRPFMTAEVLRHNKKPKLNITWDKDRGKDVESAPWFKMFKGERINDHHLAGADRRAAKEKRGG